MEKRFGVLRFIGNVYRMLGILALSLTLLSSITICLSGGALGAALAEQSGSSADSGAFAVLGIAYGVFILLYGVAFSLGLYGLGEAIFVFLGIEENTRRTSLLLSRKQGT